MHYNTTFFFFFFSSRRRHTRYWRDWSSDVCSSDLVLFSDIRGFTARSESMAAQDVVRFLNEIHTPLTEHVLESGGTLDKFIGDRKSTRLNSSHANISYAVFCLKKKLFPTLSPRFCS